MSIDLKSATLAAQQVREAIAALKARQSELTKQAAGVTARRDELMSAPLSREDAKAEIMGMVDSIGAEFIERSGWRSVFEAIAFPVRDRQEVERGMRNWQGHDKGGPFTAVTLADLDKAEQYGDEKVFGEAPTRLFSGASLSFSSPYGMAFFFGDLIKAKIEQHFEEVFPFLGTVPEGIPKTVAERRKELESLQATLTSIAKEQASVSEQLKALS